MKNMNLPATKPLPWGAPQFVGCGGEDLTRREAGLPFPLKLASPFSSLSPGHKTEQGLSGRNIREPQKFRGKLETKDKFILV